MELNPKAFADALVAYDAAMGDDPRTFNKVLALRAAIRAYEKNSGWVKTAENTPEDGAVVMVFDPAETPSMWAAQWLAGSQTFEEIQFGWYAKDEITHWMPLPELPP